jgi:creatinine amidohydrolase
MERPDLARGGYSIFDETMADMTYPELEAAARAGAVALWGLGVIEEHGPHLPLATDVYLPTVMLKLLRRLLEARGAPAVIVPPFYWGVNSVTAAFPGSITVRPEVMVELMVDVFGSLRRDGFENVFCLSGHGDEQHNRTLAEGVRKGRLLTGMRACMVLGTLGSQMYQRFGFDLSQPQFLTIPQEPPDAKQLEVHAGAEETSLLWGYFPGVVRTDVLPSLEPTNLGQEDLRELQQGWSNARRKTPRGYFGNPAGADPGWGRALVAKHAGLVADAIVARLGGGSP